MHFIIKFTQTTNYQNSPFIGKPTDRIPRDNPKNIPIFTTVKASKASIEEANSKLYYNRLFFNFLRIVAEPRKQKKRKKRKNKKKRKKKKRISTLPSLEEKATKRDLQQVAKNRWSGPGKGNTRLASILLINIEATTGLESNVEREAEIQR